MLSKNEVKYIISLNDKKNRDRDGVFIAEGPKLVNELKTNGWLPKIIYTTENKEEVSKAGFEIKTVNQQELQRLSRFESANQTLGIFHKRELPPYHLSNKISLVLDGIQDPGNLGSMIRTADWFGITQIFASFDTADCYNAKVVQSTMGSLARVHIYYTELTTFFSGLNILVMGALLTGDSLYQISPISEGIIVIGNESKGIRDEVLPFIRQAVTIPCKGGAESLNAAVAAGILLSHLVKT